MLGMILINSGQKTWKMCYKKQNNTALRYNQINTRTASILKIALTKDRKFQLSLSRPEGLILALNCANTALCLLTFYKAEITHYSRSLCFKIFHFQSVLLPQSPKERIKGISWSTAQIDSCKKG